MKIKEIKLKQGSYSIYQVTFKPNWLEKLFGVEEKTKEYKDTDSTFTFGNGHVYRNREGEELGNGNWVGEAIDKFRRQW
jgi:hypothetical protein